MMNTEQLNAYLEKRHANSEQPTSEVETTKANVEDTKVQETNTVEASEEKIETGSEDENKVENETQPVETKPEDKPAEKKPETQKKQYSKQEKIDFAFQKEKAKRKKLEARIRELEEQLKNQPNKTLSDFNNNVEDYFDYKFGKTTAEAEHKRLEDEIVESKRYEAEQINKQRIINCFPDEAEQAKYNQLVAQNGPKFVKMLDDADPEGAILGYLDDSDVAPILIRIMMTNKDYRDGVLSKSSPYGKQRAMEQLEAKVRWAQQQLANKAAKKEAAPAEPAKPTIPVVGTVTKSDSNDGAVVKDYNQVLQKLNARRYK
jgi:chemotaxis protein histidine kinase CheA